MSNNGKLINDKRLAKYMDVLSLRKNANIHIFLANWPFVSFNATGISDNVDYLRTIHSSHFSFFFHGC